jgi:hypothetical protein
MQSTPFRHALTIFVLLINMFRAACVYLYADFGCCSTSHSMTLS